LLIARTFQKLDPNNRSAKDLIDQLSGYRQMQAAQTQAQSQIGQIEASFRANPANAQLGMQLVSTYAQLRNTNGALGTLDAMAQAITNDAVALVPVAQAYAQLGQPAKMQLTVTRLVPLAERILANPEADSNQLQAALQTYQLAGNAPRMADSLNRLLKLSPTSPELWYDLGALLTFQARTNEAITAVSNAVRHSNARLQQKVPNANNLQVMAVTDQRFNAIRANPEFQKALQQKP
jgi:tetratricopeptide (TPR) repeat protein